MLANSFCRDSGRADSGDKALVPPCMGVVFARFDSLNPNAHLGTRTREAMNGTPHGFFFDTKNLLQAGIGLCSGSDIVVRVRAKLRFGLHIVKGSASCSCTDYYWETHAPFGLSLTRRAVVLVLLMYRVIQTDVYRGTVFRGSVHAINEIVSLRESIRNSRYF